MTVFLNFYVLFILIVAQNGIFADNCIDIPIIFLGYFSTICVDVTKPIWTINVQDQNVKFYYKSRKFPQMSEVTKDTVTNKTLTDFDPKRRTAFIIHGWNDDVYSPLNTEVSNALLTVENWNIFIVDWGSISKLDYITSRSKIYDIGDIIAQFITKLQSNLSLTLDKLSLFGHSLGAHISGRIGSHFQKPKVAFIVGMDPASPLFNSKNKSEVLDPSDANYVQVIHTCTFFLGIAAQLGHSDFYPNGGAFQIGCLFDLYVCPHDRSYYLFAESITKNDFLGTQCSDFSTYAEFNSPCKNNPKARMGGNNLDTKAKGKYYLVTNAFPPYGQN